MSPELYGLMMYAVGLLTLGGIYAIVSLGLNVQWGYTGLFNLGIAGFFAIGAYASAILTAPEVSSHIAGLRLPVVLGLVVAAAASGIVAYAIGRLTLRLQSDYLAIATIGVGEILRLILKNEAWLTNGALGISAIPRPFEGLPPPWDQFAFLAVVALVIALIYVLLERARLAPWGRVMRAIRDNETAARAAGKDTMRFRLEAFVLGSMIMGLGGGVYAHYVKFISPEAFEPMMTTFIVWVMLVAGGSGNNRGAIVGPLLVWTIWSVTEFATLRLPPEWTTQAAYLRIFLIGLALQIILQKAPRGLLPEPTVLSSVDKEKTAGPRARPSR
ncbi:MAG TPA: branched-chain amino acid ABC transporter permease [Alphaproteobacteria bacterium]|nr:branched-chain amino acid ABC transporter permease [Alphaproteobacteria bacterium]